MSESTRNNIILWAVVAGLTITAFCLLFFLRGDYSLVGWMNATFFSGGIIFAMGLLALVHHLGAFDMFVYGVRDVFFHMNPNPSKQKQYADFVDYLEKKKEARRKKKYYFLIPFVVFGVSLLITAIILRVIYASETGIGI